MDAPSDDSTWEYVHSTSDSLQEHVNHDRRIHCKTVTCQEKAAELFGNAFSVCLHIHDVQELMSGCTLALDEEGINCEEKPSLCEELNSNPVKSLTNEKFLGKSATFPCPKKLASPVSAIGNEEAPDITCEGQCSLKSDRPACTRSISLPSSLKLVSAMKGSRELQGRNEKVLTVTWAPDVYDPHITSLSHTVTCHSQQRSRTNKKNSKHKRKGKSSRGSSEKKQYRKHGGNSELQAKSQATDDGLFHQSTVDFLDFSVTGQESNCGSSFHKTSIGNVHIPFAEAT